MYRLYIRMLKQVFWPIAGLFYVHCTASERTLSSVCTVYKNVETSLLASRRIFKGTASERPLFFDMIGLDEFIVIKMLLLLTMKATVARETE